MQEKTREQLLEEQREEDAKRLTEQREAAAELVEAIAQFQISSSVQDYRDDPKVKAAQQRVLHALSPKAGCDDSDRLRYDEEYNKGPLRPEEMAGFHACVGRAVLNELMWADSCSLLPQRPGARTWIDIRVSDASHIPMGTLKRNIGDGPSETLKEDASVLIVSLGVGSYDYVSHDGGADWPNTPRRFGAALPTQ